MGGIFCSSARPWGGQRPRTEKTTMNGHTIQRGVGLTFALALTLAVADRAEAATTQCVGCFAALDGNANINRSRGVASTKKLQNGVYEVLFSKLITKCVYTATPGFPFSAPINLVQPSFISAINSSGSNASK